MVSILMMVVASTPLGTPSATAVTALIQDLDARVRQMADREKKMVEIMSRMRARIDHLESVLNRSEKCRIDIHNQSDCEPRTISINGSAYRISAGATLSLELDAGEITVNYYGEEMTWNTNAWPTRIHRVNLLAGPSPGASSTCATGPGYAETDYMQHTHVSVRSGGRNAGKESNGIDPVKTARVAGSDNDP